MVCSIQTQRKHAHNVFIRKKGTQQIEPNKGTLNSVSHDYYHGLSRTPTRVEHCAVPYTVRPTSFLNTPKAPNPNHEWMYSNIRLDHIVGETSLHIYRPKT